MRLLIAFVAGLALVAAVALFAAPDAHAQSIEVRVITADDTDNDNDPDVSRDERLPAAVELFVDGTSTTTLTTSLTGIFPGTSHDVLGTVGAGSDVVVCQEVPATHHFILAKITGVTQVTVADPASMGRPCVGIKATTASINVLFLNEERVDLNVLTVSDTDLDGSIDITVDERVPADVELFVAANSVNDLTTSHTGIHDSTSIADFLGTAGESDIVIVCAADIADHTTVSVTGAAAADPTLNRSCGAVSITAGMIADGRLDFYVNYLPDPCVPATATPTVTNANQLDTAIDCYNAQTPTGDHTITVGADIAHSGGTPAITQTDPNITLTITSDATRRTITGPGDDAIAGDIDLFAVQGAGPVAFNDLSLAGADDDIIFSWSVSTLTISNATLEDSGGKGVRSGGTLVLSNSTITNNTDFGMLSNGATVVSNSTITNNDNGVLTGWTTTISNSTIANNGTGISNSGGTVTVVSSIVTDNFNEDCHGPVTDGGNNFASDDTCVGFTALSPGGAGSLGALADNGGPTPTRELLAASNAVDAGDCTDVVVGLDSSENSIIGDLEFDQRGTGFARSIGICDAGAFEADPFVRYNPLTPSRILDTRPGFASAGNPADGADTPVGAGDANVRTVKVADLALAGVPANATAVAIHVTSVGPTADSFLTVWPDGTRPNAASKNFGITAGGPFGYAGLTNDLLIVPVGPGGTVQVYNDAGTVDLVIDVVGYYAPTGDLYNPLTPSRILDTRPGFASAGNTDDGPDTPIGAGDANVRTVDVADLSAAGVPFNATAVAIHVTSVSPTADSFLTVWPDGTRPNAASKNFGITAGGTFGYAGLTNDLLIVPVGSGGTVQVYNDAGTVDLVIDVVGYYAPTGDLYKPLFPSRILDTRPGFASAGNPADGPDTPVGAGDANVRTVTVADLALAGVPDDATAVAIHVTSVGPTANSFLTVWPDGTRPNAASKNFGITAGGPFGYAGLTNDLLLVPVGPGGTIQIYNDAGTVDLVIDIVGYTTATPPPG